MATTELGSLAESDPSAARRRILSGLDATKGDAELAAKREGMSRKQFYNVLNRLGLREEIDRRRQSGKYEKSGGARWSDSYSYSSFAARLREGYKRK